jgi:hypothetical protein
VSRRAHLLIGLLLLGLVGGCATGHGRDIDDPTNSLLFGYIDMSEAPTDIQSTWVFRVTPPTERPYWPLSVRKGLFHSSYLPPGTYQVSKFGGSGFFRGNYEYGFPRQGRNATAVRATKPGIYYMGSYKYKKVKTGIFEQGRFDIQRVNTPTERELLQRLLKEDDDIRDSGWADKIRARLKELGS